MFNLVPEFVLIYNMLYLYNHIGLAAKTSNLFIGQYNSKASSFSERLFYFWFFPDSTHETITE
jgi:hypothetical protein